MTPFSSPRSRLQLAWAAVAAAWVGGAALAWQAGRIGDEWVHFEQVLAMLGGAWRHVDPSLTTPTGFHAVIAATMGWLGLDSLGAARLLCALAGVGAVAAFHVVRRWLHGEEEALATVQLAALPLLFPFVFLVYSDVPALACVLAAWWLALRGRHVFAAVLLLASALGVRQANIAWAAFIAAHSLWISLRWTPWRDAARASRIAVPYLAAGLVFTAVWIERGRLSLSESQAAAHPDFVFHAGNVYFALALLGALMPLHLAIGAGRFLAMARARPAWWLLPAGCAGLFAFAFAVDHPYNLVVPHYNLRNALLLHVDSSGAAKALFGLIATLSACFLATQRRAWILLPFAALLLSASWLIEPRYSLVPIALFLALRRRESSTVEGTTLALWLAMAVFVATSIFDYRFMI